MDVDVKNEGLGLAGGRRALCKVPKAGKPPSTGSGLMSRVFEAFLHQCCSSVPTFRSYRQRKKGTKVING